MGETHHLLVLDLEPGGLADLVRRLRRLHLPALHARTAGEAERLLDAEGARLGAVLFGPELVGSEFELLLSHARECGLERTPTLVVVGPAPDPAHRVRLRAAGVEHALWQPFDDRTLRFVVNESLAPPDAIAAREGIRVPSSVVARVEVGGRSRELHAYSLSTSGAFLETPRPAIRGAAIVVELPLAGGILRANARVIFTNVPGNLHRPNLPLGMGIHFEGLEPPDAARLRRCVEEGAARITV